MFPDFPSLLGINLAHVIISIVAILAIYVMFKEWIDNILILIKLSRSKSKSDSKTKPEDKAKTKTKRKWKFNFPVFGGVKNFFKSMTFEKFVIFFITPAVIIISAWLWHRGVIELSKMDVFWLIIIGLALTIFSSRSQGFQFLVGVGLFVFFCYLTYLGFASLNLKGTPHPIKVITVTNLNDLKFDARIPRWTGYDFKITEDCFIDLSAFGKIDFDTSDGYPRKGYPPNGPDGVRHHKGNHKKNGIYYLTPSQVKRPWEFIYGFQDKPFACLIGKIGIEGDIFIIGDRCQIPMKPGDILYLGLNYRWRRVGGNNAWRLSWKFAKGYFNLKAKILPTSRSA